MDEREKLLLMAAYVHGPLPGEEIRANCARVLRQALIWAGLWVDEMQSILWGELENKVADEWYDTLIRMTQRTPTSEALIEGAGNLVTPAAAAFTGCRLTDKGRRFAEEALAEHQYGK